MNMTGVKSIHTPLGLSHPPMEKLLYDECTGVLVAYDDGTSETYYTDDSWKTLDETTPAGFEDMDLDDSPWISATEWVNGEANLVTVPRA
ncbi:uncharacterized protein BT62DRAFT_936234 [Guyanagaster necrorhizus]|uniref:Uncharacterized protein n=1 Tax=Guyanagaster necrorhizus TaxID=856835 RepID=A0A9P7VKX4_9AGAR|nr:uncharacterized protein BT62DRAFT_936234 [Guyanagaster necrorhizus MCA 3950]KAG7442377.1 hypothetical protein BT62DRAFT_936234 [Guyanagaster necrorhizus MCA 3950]